MGLNCYGLRYIVYAVAEKKAGKWHIMLSTSLTPNPDTQVQITDNDPWFNLGSGDEGVVVSFLFFLNRIAGFGDNFVRVKRTTDRMFFVREKLKDAWPVLQRRQEQKRAKIQ